MYEFFHGNGQGLSKRDLETAGFHRAEATLGYHRTDTEHLMEMYWMSRLQEQLKCESSEYGTLTVRAYFNHDSLCVEVIQAKDVIPLDPNGTSKSNTILKTHQLSIRAI